MRSSKSLIVPWYTRRSSFFSGLRKAECVRKRRQYVSEICSRRAGVRSGVVEKNTCSCRAMEMCQPPLIRRTLHIQLVTPWWNFLNPSLPPSSTFLLAAVSLAEAHNKSVNDAARLRGWEGKRQKCCKRYCSHHSNVGDTLAWVYKSIHNNVICVDCLLTCLNI